MDHEEDGTNEQETNHQKNLKRVKECEIDHVIFFFFLNALIV